MHIVCPNCAASYKIDASVIGPAGRSVRCVRCRSVWHQALPEPELPAANDVVTFKSELGPPAAAEPPAPEPAAEAIQPAPAVTENGDPAGPPLEQLIGPNAEPSPEAAAEPPAGASLSDITIPAAPPAADEAPAVDAQADSDIESIAARRRARRGTARRRIPSSRFARMPALILTLACVIAALIGWRGHIVRHAPQMASLYAAIGLPVNLRGLTFTDVKVSRDVHDGVSVLVVEGAVVSTASRAVEVPRLRFAMRNEAGGEVYAWTAMPSREVLEPGETLPFRSRLASPPSEGRDVTVRFFTRLDAVAGLR
jgi:predicted Zn finger-like uncharacterized protein